MMLTEICQEIRNWFNRDTNKFYGSITVRDGAVLPDIGLKDGQYFLLAGSVFNDGAHVFPYDKTLIDEDFVGVVQAMAVPPAVVALATEIEAWREKYGGVDGVLASPYSSESFGGYSYSKISGNGAGSPVTWKSMFADRLNRWRKI